MRLLGYLERVPPLPAALTGGFPRSYHQLVQNPNNESLRNDCIGEIIKTISNAQDSPSVCTGPHRKLVERLRSVALGKWKHLIITPNWDLLLEREITFQMVDACPPWLVDSHVFHLNGTIEKEVATNSKPPLSRRSTFLLPCDSPARRRKAIESNRVFNKLLWGKRIVVVGMSFECGLDKGFLGALSGCRDEMPIGEATWILVNNCRTVLDRTKESILAGFPSSSCRVVCVHENYETWVSGTMDEVFQ